MENKTKDLINKMTVAVEKISVPLIKFSTTPVISSIISGITALVPLIMIGSFFLILYVLGSPSVGLTGKALVPLLTPLINKFVWVNSVTMGLMALSGSISIAYYYSEKQGLDRINSILISVTTFILFTVNGYDEAGGISVSSFGAGGLFAAMLTSIVSISIYNWCVKRNITIKIPDQVPPNVARAFTALIPFFISFTVAWTIRTIFEFDFVEFLNGVLTPIVSKSDSVYTAMFLVFVVLLLWSVGLHGDNMLLSLLTPFGLLWIEENAKLLSSGTSIYNLPYILAGIGETGLIRLTVWTSAAWPLIFYMIISKKKYLKSLGWAFFTPGIFTIVEPM